MYTNQICGSRGSTNTCVGEQKRNLFVEKQYKRLPSYSPPEMFVDPLNPPLGNQHQTNNIFLDTFPKQATK